MYLKIITQEAARIIGVGLHTLRATPAASPETTPTPTSSPTATATVRPTGTPSALYRLYFPCIGYGGPNAPAWSSTEEGLRLPKWRW